MKGLISMRRGFLLSGIAVATLAATMSGAAIASQAGAAHRLHYGKFSCKAWGAKIGGKSFAVANRVNLPCQDKLARVDKAGKTLGNVRLGVMTARTRLIDWRHVRPATHGTASARTAKVVLGLAKGKALKIGVATSAATDRCVAKGGKLVVKQTSQSNVAYIAFGGKKTLIGNKRMKMPLGALGTIYFNRVLRHGNTLTRRAVEIDLGGKKPTVILAQSQVGYTGRPCAKS